MKILLCNEAFIGDLILSTSVLPVLKSHYPDCKIGFLVGSWAKEVVENHKLVDFVHVYDQRSFNRARKSKRLKRQQEIGGKAQALQEVKEVGYDVALDLHSYYGENSAHFIFRSDIPETVAYWSSKKPFFYKTNLFWDCTQYHMLENHAMMLSEWGGLEIDIHSFRPYLEYKVEIENPFLRELPEKYILLHIGTGEYGREWETSSWVTLAKKLDVYGIPLVFIGKGAREKAKISDVIKHLKNGVDFSDKFTWKQLIMVVKKAKFLVGLESMAGHMAAAFGIPALLIYAGKLPVNWRPYHPLCHIIMAPSMSAQERKKVFPKPPIHFLKAETVFEKLEKLLFAHNLV